jgi:hypothetical protein
VVERRLAKAKVASSNLVFRSIGRHSQGVRQGSAKPSFPGSNPGGASSGQGPQPISRIILNGSRFFISREGVSILLALNKVKTTAFLSGCFSLHPAG